MERSQSKLWERSSNYRKVFIIVLLAEVLTVGLLTGLFIVKMKDDIVVKRIYSIPMYDINILTKYVFLSSENIVGIAPSDFDGDGDMDLLVSTVSSTKTITSEVYFGNRETLTKCMIIFIYNFNSYDDSISLMLFWKKCFSCDF